MIVDAYSSRDIDRCQCLTHTGRVSTSTTARSRTSTTARSRTSTTARSGTSTTAPGRSALPPAAACCTPLLGEPITAGQAADLAYLLRALADPTRLRLVSMVAAHEGGEACVCDLTAPLRLTQPTISHHLKILVDAGIFSRDKRGVWAYYALVPAALDALSAVLCTTRQPGRPAPS
jgi:ArsR family transcriptional regulator, arsenate/arsenite/antimonite-responsive transcriptional repressor